MKMRATIIGFILSVLTLSIAAQDIEIKNTRTVSYEVSTEGLINFSGDYVPFFLHSNRHGIASIEPNSGYVRAGAFLPLRNKKGWDWGFGVDLLGTANHQSPFLVHQLYAEVQWACLDLLIGSKEYSGEMRHPLLSSGGLTWSGNSRPIPMVKAGIFDFVKIPKIPVEIKLHASYGVFTDNREKEDRFNFKSSFITTNSWYHDKKIFFRSPSEYPLIFTFGAEVSTQFAGRYRRYSQGRLLEETNPGLKFKDFFTALIAGKGDSRAAIGDQVFAYGSHLGSLHLQGEYHFKDHSYVKLYGEGQWDDGSGLQRLNGMDGLWGVEWCRPDATTHRYLKGLVVEYFQSTNQSGPMLFWPSDYPNLVQGGMQGMQATGADDYYNNFYYDSWAHWGQTSGTPLIVSPLYNGDGHLRIKNNRINAVHLGVMGEIVPTLDYRLKVHWRRGLGTPFIPLLEPNYNTSAMVEVSYSPRYLKGWKATGAYSIDRGSMIGNNSGLMISISKSGSLFKL